MFFLLYRMMLTVGEASDEVATLESHTINADTDKNFCDLCVNRLPEGSGEHTEGQGEPDGRDG
jgi:hypothetical protein